MGLILSWTMCVFCRCTHNYSLLSSVQLQSVTVNWITQWDYCHQLHYFSNRLSAVLTYNVATDSSCIGLTSMPPATRFKSQCSHHSAPLFHTVCHFTDVIVHPSDHVSWCGWLVLVVTHQLLYFPRYVTALFCLWNWNVFCLSLYSVFTTLTSIVQ